MASVSKYNLEIMKHECSIYLFDCLLICNLPCSKKDFQAADKDIKNKITIKEFIFYFKNIP